MNLVNELELILWHGIGSGMGILMLIINDCGYMFLKHVDPYVIHNLLNTAFMHLMTEQYDKSELLIKQCIRELNKGEHMLEMRLKQYINHDVVDIFQWKFL